MMIRTIFLGKWKFFKYLTMMLFVYGLSSCSSPAVELGATSKPVAYHKKKPLTKTEPKEWYEISGRNNLYVFSLIPISKDYYARLGYAKAYQISENFNSPKELLKNLIKSKKKHKNARVVMKKGFTWEAGERRKRFRLPITYAEVLYDDDIDGIIKVISLVDKNNLNKIRWCLKISSRKDLGYFNNSSCFLKYRIK